jgi:hypothetical protein
MHSNEKIEDISQEYETSLDYENLHCHVKRIDDHHFYLLFRESICIDIDYFIWWEIKDSFKKSDPPLNLAKYYTMFRHAFGESGNHYDDWKGAFNFAFKVDVLNDLTVTPYILNVVNLRGAVEFKFRKIILPEDLSYERGIVHPAFADEFSLEQMNFLAGYLSGFAEGFWGKGRIVNIENFVKEVSSNKILFGCLDGCFFEKYFEDADEFQDNKFRILTKINQKKL